MAGGAWGHHLFRKERGKPVMWAEAYAGPGACQRRLVSSWSWWSKKGSDPSSRSSPHNVKLQKKLLQLLLPSTPHIQSTGSLQWVSQVPRRRQRVDLFSTQCTPPWGEEAERSQFRKLAGKSNELWLIQSTSWSGKQGGLTKGTGMCWI